jgi:hypothetical protein
MLDYYLQDGIGRDEYLARVEENFQAWIDSHLEEDANWREQFEKMEAVWAERRDLLLPELDADA